MPHSFSVCLAFTATLGDLRKILLLFTDLVLLLSFEFQCCDSMRSAYKEDICVNWRHRARGSRQTLQRNLYPIENVPGVKMFLLMKLLVAGWAMLPWAARCTPAFHLSVLQLSLSLFPPPFNTITSLLTVFSYFKGMSVYVCAAFPAGPTPLSWKELSTLSIL